MLGKNEKLAFMNTYGNSRFHLGNEAPEKFADALTDKVEN